LRVEFVVAIVCYFAYALIRYRPFWKSLCLSLFATVVPLSAMEFSMFGTLVPNTAAAKGKIYEVPLSAWFKMLFPRVSDSSHWGDAVGFAALIALGVLLLWSLAETLRKANLDRIPLLGVGVGILGAYLINLVFLFSWYIPLFLVPLVIVWLDSPATYAAWAKRTLVVVVVAPFLLQLAGNVAAVALERPELSTQFVSGARVRQYLHVGRTLYERFPQAQLMTSEIGGLGYSFRGYIYDAAGLAQPAALRYHPMKVPEERSHGMIGAIPPGFVAEVKPDIIVTHDIFAEALLRSPIVQEYDRYVVPIFLEEDMRRVARPTLWGGKDLNILIRKEAGLQWNGLTEDGTDHADRD
jgi:hypothetical protein